MNDQDLGNYSTVQGPPPYKDRSTGLVIFGILTVLLGGLAALMVVAILVGQAFASASGASPKMDTAGILPAIFDVHRPFHRPGLVGHRINLAKRWARALMLIFSWAWLIVGILAMAMTVFVLPKIFANMPATAARGQPAMPPGAMEGVLIFVSLFYGVVFIVTPAIWTFFYSSRHVKATCEARDPVTRWTDRCPLPVLGLVLWMAFSGLTMLIMPVAVHGVTPFFGTFLTGIAGDLFYLVVAAFWLYAAWLCWKLDLLGWWLVLVVTLVFMASSTITYMLHDPIEMYRLMNYPQAQIDQIQKMGFFTGNHMLWMTSFFILPLVGYLLFVKKYFRTK